MQFRLVGPLLDFRTRSWIPRVGIELPRIDVATLQQTYSGHSKYINVTTINHRISSIKSVLPPESRWD